MSKRSLLDITVPISREDLHRVEYFVHEIMMKKPDIHRTIQTPEERISREKAGKLGEVVFGRRFGWDVNFHVGQGGDGYDFLLSDGRSTLDVKSVPVESNMKTDFKMLIADGETLNDFYAQVLIAPDCGRGVITGWISLIDFFRFAKRQTNWIHRGGKKPWMVSRSKLNQDYPSFFYRFGDIGQMGQGFSLISPPPRLCQQCAVEHHPDHPHDKNLSFYQYWFYSRHGRWPTWSDAIAHCGESVKKRIEAFLRDKEIWEDSNSSDSSKALKNEL